MNRTATAVAMLLVLQAVTVAHAAPRPKPPKDWDPKNSTAGLELIVVSVDPPADFPNGTVAYQFRVSGSGSDLGGRQFSIFFKDLMSTGSLAHEVLIADVSGKLLMTDGKPWDIVLTDYAQAEPVWFALTSKDGTLKTFLKHIPFPVESREGRCRLSAEMISLDAGDIGRPGPLYGIRGEGFAPDEEVTITRSSEGNVVEDKGRASPAGSLGEFYSPRVAGRKSGSAKLQLSAASCRPAIEFKWKLTGN